MSDDKKKPTGPALLKMWKKYSDGEVRCLEVNDTSGNAKTLMQAGFFLTEEEADPTAKKGK